MKRLLCLFLSTFFLIANATTAFEVDYTDFNQNWAQFKEAYSNEPNFSMEREFELLDEFSLMQLPRQRAFIEGVDRYPEWVPFNENKVVLSDSRDVSASYIDLGEGVNFIACQAPLQSNLDLFWQLVWEKNIDQIVMTTELLDEVDNEELCYPYWPNVIGETLQLGNGIAVTFLDDRILLPELSENIQIRKFLVTHEDSAKVVTHYWYHKWPDDGVPNGYDSVRTLIHSVKNDKEASGSNAPILAHCAAGVGRTGVFISLYTITKSGPVDLFDFVGKLRWLRPDTVGSFVQYQYISNFN